MTKFSRQPEICHNTSVERKAFAKVYGSYKYKYIQKINTDYRFTSLAEPKKKRTGIINVLQSLLRVSVLSLVANIVVVYVGWKTLIVYQHELEEMRSSSTQTDDIILKMSAQLTEAKRVALSAAVLADAASKSARVAEENLRVSKDSLSNMVRFNIEQIRSRIATEGVAEEEQFVGEADHAKLRIMISNKGHSPALNVTVFQNGGILDRPPAESDRLPELDRSRFGSDELDNLDVLSGETRYTQSFFLTKSQLMQILNKNNYSKKKYFYIYGHISYIDGTNTSNRLYKRFCFGFDNNVERHLDGSSKRTFSPLACPGLNDGN